jgi:hypothetical protein
MRTPPRSSLFALALLAGAAVPAGAQQPAAPAPPALVMPAVGDVAPDFSIRGATRYGLLKDRAQLSDYRGKTVVLAFFVIARTRG